MGMVAAGKASIMRSQGPLGPSGALGGFLTAAHLKINFPGNFINRDLGPGHPLDASPLEAMGKHLQPPHAVAHHFGVLQVWAAARDFDRTRGPADRTRGDMSKHKHVPQIPRTEWEC